LPFLVNCDKDGKRLSSSELVFDLPDVKDLDEFLLDYDDKVLLDDKDEVLLDNMDKVASCN
jgi:hypothetical protein